MVVVHAGRILGAGALAIGGADFTRAVARATGVDFGEARLERLKISHADAQSEEHRDKRDLHTARTSGVSDEIERQREIVDGACRELSQSFVRQLCQFREQLAKSFPSHPIDRLVFVGGEAHNRKLCRSIARAVGLSALVGDPLLRLGRTSDLGFEAGIDRREPQPAWAVAIGLSLGAATFSTSGEIRRQKAPYQGQRAPEYSENLR
jgi:cell division ATPase FtsA